jgi:hypothetical protein
MTQRVKWQIEIVVAPLLVGADPVIGIDEWLNLGEFLVRDQVDDSIALSQNEPA